MARRIGAGLLWRAATAETASRLCEAIFDAVCAAGVGGRADGLRDGPSRGPGGFYGGILAAAQSAVVFGPQSAIYQNDGADCEEEKKVGGCGGFRAENGRGRNGGAFVADRGGGCAVTARSISPWTFSSCFFRQFLRKNNLKWIFKTFDTVFWP